MRTAFIDQLIKETRKNDKIFLLVGDLGYNVIEPFANEFPNRFRNVGIAEQNMAGVAAGLAMSGFNVYFYSIGNFPTLRCIEQIRNDIAYHHANVKVVAVGGGYAYGDLGATHHATEALGMLRTIPDMVVCSPSDPIETRALTTLSSTYEGPMYIQLGKAGEKLIHENELKLNVGDILPYRVNNKKEAISVLEPGDILDIGGHVMIYLGKYEGKHYIISMLSTYVPEDVTSDFDKNAVKMARNHINSLDVHRRNGNTWMEEIKSYIHW